MLHWLTKLFARRGRSAPRRAWRVLRARYDAAVTTDENRRHWANADGMSANSANSPDVRRTLRNRLETALAPRMATGDPAGAEVRSRGSAVALECFEGVSRTGRLEAARAAEPRTQQ